MNKEIEIYKAKDLMLAEIRLFNAERESSLIPKRRAYTIMLKNDQTYIDLYDKYNRSPIYERVPYSNTTIDGEDYGTMIRLVDGEIKDGQCYILDTSMDKVLRRDIVYKDELDKYIINSDMFFPARIKLYDNMTFYDKVKYRKKYILDKEDTEEYNNYLNSNNTKRKIR